MTLAAPKSRQGKFVLVLAFLAATVAVLGALVWANSAEADIPAGTTIVVTDDAGATVTQGTPIEYTLTVDVNGAAGGVFANPTISIDFDDDLQNFLAVSATGLYVPGDCTNGANNVVTCTEATGPIVDGDVVIQFNADGATVSPPTACTLVDDGNGVATCDLSSIAAVTVTDGATVTSATNFPGEPHIFNFTLEPGVTCENDNDNTNNAVDCLNADVTIGGTDTCAVTSGPTVTTGALATQSVVSVGIDGGTGIEGTCTVTLAVTYVGPDEDGDETDDDFDIDDVVATKTFDVAEAAGELRHLDDADAASEDAAGTTDSDKLEDWCVGATATCGVLTPQDDSDDATGSFHQACIINTTLTNDGDSGFIDWNIVGVAGSPLPTAVSITEVRGPHQADPALAEACVRWSTGFTGVQNITAVYDNGIGPAVTFYWDGYCVAGATPACTAVDDADDAASGAASDPDPVPLPLVKQWNTIDETKIVAVTGVVGDTLDENTLELDNWASRDCSTDPADAGFCDNANLDGLTLPQEATIFLQTPQLFINAPAVSFIDYTLGAHDAGQGGSYAGPVDGAEQTYTISGDCGSVRLEDPQNGATTIVLSQGDVPVTVLTSDKGVGFTFVPNDDGAIITTQSNADCGPDAQICIDVATEEDNLFHSGPLDDAADEEICVTYNIGVPTSKTPQLAWAGQRGVVEQFWGSIDSNGDLVCPYGNQESFYVLYSVQAGPGSFTAALQGSLLDSSQTGQDVIVEVNSAADADEPNSGCISRVIFENQDQAQNDIIAYVVDDVDLNTASAISQQAAFVIYYMKFEDATLTLVPGARADHNDGAFTPNSPLDSTDDVTEMILPDDAVNVSADVLARLRVRGWVETTNCPVRDSGTGANGEFLPANRCIFPDDWRFKAGGGVGDSLNDAATTAGFAEESRPNFDIAGVVPAAPGNQSPCNGVPRASGPFSWLDTNVQGDISAAPCGDSLAPNVDTAGANVCSYDIGYSCREVVFPNGVINAWDAPMPPALARFALSGSGFLRPADKADVYSSGNLFYTTHIPAEPWIAPINADLSGYQWNTWGAPGAKAGQYEFWTSLADSSAEVVSCAGPSSGVVWDPTNGVAVPACDDAVRTGGYSWTKVYTDNHGEAMTWINGDANLTFDDCESSAADAGNMIVLLSGYYCENDDLVGSSVLGASVDYPDKRKHFAIESNEVEIDWTWGGIKEVNVVPGSSAQFNYVVFSVTDRDGECRAFNNGSGQKTLHSVLGERVVFTIDSPSGIIFPNVNGDPAALLGTWSTKTADVKTFDTGTTATIALGGLEAATVVDGECQAWIHISESLLSPVNVIVTAYDPEGTVTFDKIVNEPTPTPTAPPTASPEPTPTATPANQQNLWADIDCSQSVGPVDALKMLRSDAGLSVSQEANCPLPSADVDLIWDGQTTNEKWADADCSGSIVTPVDALKVLRFDAGLSSIQNEPCPDIGQEVLIPLQS